MRDTMLSSSWLVANPCTELQRSPPIPEALVHCPMDDECV